MTKKQETVEQEKQEAAENLQQAAGDFLERHGDELAEAKVDPNGVIQDPQPAADPVAAAASPEPEVPAVPAPTGIPSAADIRLLHQPEPELPFDSWLEATRNQLGNYLRQHAQLLTEGTELEYQYQSSSVTERALWANHYITLQAELQRSGYAVFMIGRADNPFLRIKLASDKKVVAE